MAYTPWTLDPVINFGKVTALTGYSAAATQIALIAGDGARLPDPVILGAYNIVWWNSTDYQDSADDPNREIIRVVGGAGDVKTVVRGQEGTTPSIKNIPNKTYKLALTPTKKTIDDILDGINYAIGLIPTFGTGNQVLGMNAAGTAFEWKTINAGANVIITYGVGTISIAATGGGGSGLAFVVNVGTGTGEVFRDITGGDTINLKTLLASPLMIITNNADDIEFDIDTAALALDTDFIDDLIANNYFTTNLAGDSNFITELTNNATFQTLVNNFVSGGGGSGGVSKLAIDTSSITAGGSGSYTVLIPGGTLGTNNAIRFKVLASQVNLNAGDTITVTVTYGGQPAGTATIPFRGAGSSFTTDAAFLEGVIVATGATNTQRGYFSLGAKVDTSDDTTIKTGTASIAGVDSTVNQNLVVTFTRTNNGDLNAHGIIVEKIGDSTSGGSSDKFVGTGEAIAKSYFNIQVPFTVTGEGTDNMWSSSGGSTIQSYAQWSTAGNGDGVYLDAAFGGFPAFLPTSNAEFRQFNLGKIIIAETVAYIDPTEANASFLGFAVLGSSTHPDVASNTLSVGFVRDAAGAWYVRSATGAAHTDTAISAPTNAAHTYRIEYDPAGTEARFFIDGSSVGVVTTNLPTASTSVMGFMMRNDTSNGFEYGMAPSFSLEI